MTDRHDHPFRAALLALLLVPLYFYRWVISPLLPHVCRFTPSCSVYALEALKTHGYIYAVTSLSPAVVRLVRSKRLRRLKNKEGLWTYVQP